MNLEKILDWFQGIPKKTSPPQPMPLGSEGDVTPPWVEYPGLPPYDYFWREAGEPWRVYIWEPFYKALSSAEREAYLKRWQVPEDWQYYYFGKEWHDLWENADREG